MVLGTSQTENAPHRIKAALKDLVVDEPQWMQRGLSPTASGYGKKIPTRYKLRYNNRLHRIYGCCFSNVVTTYIVSCNRTIIVDIEGQ
jgi:hypothetical protein